jgi:small subunit ribosomal protein S8
MAINDPISDMVTRIRNALAGKAKSVDCVNSGVCRGVAQVLKDEGYIDGFEVVQDGHSGKLRLKLKYGARGEHVIHMLRRESKPGRRVYKRVEELPRPLQGLGICVVSTSRGVLSDRKCRQHKVGGELLCVIE